VKERERERWTAFVLRFNVDGCKDQKKKIFKIQLE
jgi:hypothetical protein